jgi:hypothetical protein
VGQPLETKDPSHESKADKTAAAPKTLRSDGLPPPEAMNILPAREPMKTEPRTVVTLVEDTKGAAGAPSGSDATAKDSKSPFALPPEPPGPKEKDPVGLAPTPKPEDKRKTDPAGLDQPITISVGTTASPPKAPVLVPEVSADVGKTPTLAPTPVSASPLLPTKSEPTIKNAELDKPAARSTPTQVALGPSPTPTARLAPTTPEVDSFDEAIYPCQPGDTFASIAAKYYGAQLDYGQALLWYNRNHPDAGDGIRQEPPVLAGQRVYIPLEKRVLEQRYPKLIPGLPATAAPSAPAAPATPPATPAATPTYPQYRVAQKDGETMFAIAQRTLGNGFRWKEIAVLNPNLASDFAVEANKVLRLPPDARVPADNVSR